MRRGLVFGKYMPLHRGHQFVIDRAFAECDEVAIVVYDNKPEGDYPPMPVEKRLGWLRMLYPQAESIVALPDPIPGGDDSPDVAEVYAEQVVDRLGEFDRVFTSEPSYERFAELLEAKHVLVDERRYSVPISGTEIRSNLYEYRGWLDPRVYVSLIRKVVFVGTESSGKTSLAKAMAKEYKTLWVHEYGRELWEAQDLQGSFADHWRMAQRQYQREQAMARHARDYLFCDTNAWTTLMWSRMNHEVADTRLEQLVADTIGEYTWVVCENDFGWVQDGTRELAGSRAELFQRMQLNELRRLGIKHYRAIGPLEERVYNLKQRLSGKYATV